MRGGHPPEVPLGQTVNRSPCARSHLRCYFSFERVYAPIGVRSWEGGGDTRCEKVCIRESADSCPKMSGSVESSSSYLRHPWCEDVSWSLRAPLKSRVPHATFQRCGMLPCAGLTLLLWCRYLWKADMLRAQGRLDDVKQLYKDCIKQF
jgi:hypothetical protein